MLAITVKYLSATNSKPCRIKAYVAGNSSFGSVTECRNYDDSHIAQIHKIAQKLEEKIAGEYNRLPNRMYGFEYTPGLWIFHKQFD